MFGMLVLVTIIPRSCEWCKDTRQVWGLLSYLCTCADPRPQQSGRGGCTLP